ncbi:hypothetical protein A2U01_0021222 [Trifolium medium]|uniref:Uncharacterized protein n=1 Tax=Trifolium medium TaxID=97028 RepID=A0A392NNZ0_9FABA|nr:hypothetical protein [Trifolium medium]
MPSSTQSLSSPPTQSPSLLRHSHSLPLYPAAAVMDESLCPIPGRKTMRPT